MFNSRPRTGRRGKNRPSQRSGRAAAPSSELVYLSALAISQFCCLLLGIFSFRALLSVTASVRVPVGLDVLKGKVNQRHSKCTAFLEEYSSCQSLHLPYCLVEANVAVVSSKREAHILVFFGATEHIYNLSSTPNLSFFSGFLWSVSANVELIRCFHTFPCRRLLALTDGCRGVELAWKQLLQTHINSGTH